MRSASRAAAMHGRALGGSLDGFDAQALYGNEMSLYAYLGANPVNRSDPLGLSWDPFDMVDDYLAESSGNRAAFMQRLNTGFDTTLYIGLQIAQLHPAVGAAVAAYKIANGTADGMDLLSLVPGGKAAGAIAKAMGFKGVYAASYAGKGLRRGATGSGHAFDMSAAVKKLRAAKGRGNNVDAPSQEEALELMQRAFPDLPPRNTYGKGHKFGWEIHGPDGSMGPGIADRPHIKFYDYRDGKGSNGISGHIYWDKLRRDD